MYCTRTAANFHGAKFFAFFEDRPPTSKNFACKNVHMCTIRGDIYGYDIYGGCNIVLVKSA